MTTQELTEQFEIWWSPDRGRTDHPELGKGALLLPREGGSSLTAITQPPRQHSANPMIRPQSRHDGGKPRKYNAAIRETARALRAQGFTCQRIVDRLQIPHGTVYGWVAGRNGR